MLQLSLPYSQIKATFQFDRKSKGRGKLPMEARKQPFIVRQLSINIWTGGFRGGIEEGHIELTSFAE